ncbi:hypothetical protein F5883DRAFT_647094 [Diaporthe sp. PMI_573]|nr:hypothetical protein F5883DRAFT_647094 [Diaporthaceae sp. PMI_573]
MELNRVSLEVQRAQCSNDLYLSVDLEVRALHRLWGVRSSPRNEDSSDEDIQTRRSESSLQEHEEPNSRPSESAGIPKIDKPQVATTQPPYGSIVEKLVPPRIATVGRVIRMTAVQMELDQEFFRSPSRSSLQMNVGMVDLNTGVAVDAALKGQKSFQSLPPVPGLSYNGARVLNVHFPDPRGFIACMSLQSCGFVTGDCPRFGPRFTWDEMEFIEEQERQGHLRLREDGGLDVVASYSG